MQTRLHSRSLLIALLFLSGCLGDGEASGSSAQDGGLLDDKKKQEECRFDPVPDAVLAGGAYRVSIDGVKDNDPSKQFYTAEVELAGSVRTADSEIPEKGTMFVSLQPWAEGPGAIIVVEHKVNKKDGTTRTKEKSRCSFTVVGTSCEPTSCEAAGVECGTIDDGCGGSLDCAGCGGSTEVCIDNSCCEPRTCESEGRACGSMDDGCGGVLECDGCEPGHTCSDDGKCVACVPRECDADACGRMDDGCGGSLECGACADGLTCQGNQCVPWTCTPRACVDAVDCGAVSDGCGGTVDCGGCAAGYKCGGDNRCVVDPGKPPCPSTPACSLCGRNPDNGCRIDPPRSPDVVTSINGYTCQEVFDKALDGDFNHNALACGLLQHWGANGCDCPVPNQPDLPPRDGCLVCPAGTVDQSTDDNRDPFHFFSVGALSCADAYSYGWGGYFGTGSLCKKTQQEAREFGCCVEP